MRPRKPDRFERMINNQCGFESVTGGEFWVSREVAAKLLRNEHAWMKRMVKQVDAWACQELADNADVVAEILKQLAQRRK